MLFFQGANESYRKSLTNRENSIVKKNFTLSNQMKNNTQNK